MDDSGRQRSFNLRRFTPSSWPRESKNLQMLLEIARDQPVEMMRGIAA